MEGNNDAFAIALFGESVNTIQKLLVPAVYTIERTDREDGTLELG